MNDGRLDTVLGSDMSHGLEIVPHWGCKQSGPGEWRRCRHDNIFKFSLGRCIYSVILIL